MPMRTLLLAKRSFVSLLSLLFSPLLVLGQLVVDETPTAQQLVNNLVGGGVTVSNVTYNGQNVQSGTFDATATVLGIDQGVILASGDINNAIGPNDQGGAGSNEGGGGDPDLEQMLGGTTTYDAAVLEFDFVPTGDSVSFEYIFGSDEYLEFVNSGFNDAFGFFLSGPGINGPYSNNSENIALIPGTNTPVSIDNVNDATNAAYYVDNGDGTTSPYDSDPQYIQYDGYTVALQATAQVQCGETYHIKIAIADAGDGIYDSGVFLEEGSFNSAKTIDVSLITAAGDSSVIEGCTDGTLTFSRQDSVGEDTIPVYYGGSAQVGTDVDPLPDSVFIQDGDTSASFTVNPIDDGVIEGTDSLVVHAFTVNSCGDTITDSSTVFIQDPVRIDSVNSEAAICSSAYVPLTVYASGGQPPYEYSIDSGASFSTDSTFDSIPAGTYDIIVQDSHGCWDTTQHQVQPSGTVALTSSAVDLDCYGDGSGVLTGHPSGGDGNYQFSIDGGTSFQNDSVFAGLSAGNYQMILEDGNGCRDTVNDTLQEPPQILIDQLDVDSASCFGACDGAVEVSVSGGTGPGTYTYNWSGGIAPPDSSNAEGLCAGSYSLTITDDSSCTIDTTFDVPEPSELQVSTSPDTTICIGGTAVLSANASGGVPGYTYHWDQGLGTGQTHSVSPGNSTVYEVYVTDANQCTSSTASVRVDYHPPLDLDLSEDDSVCPGDPIQLNANGSGGLGSGYTYDWSNGDQGASITVSPTSTTTYAVTLDDACETPTVTDSVEITVHELPDVKIEGVDLEACAPVEATLINATADSMVGDDCVWSFGDGTQAVGCDSVQHKFEEPGCYDVSLSVSSPEGCVDSSERVDYVCVRPYPDANFKAEPRTSTVQSPEVQFTNLSTGAESYKWDFGSLDSSSEEHPTFDFPNEGEGQYQVCLEATNSYACQDSICRDVIIQGEFILYVPNAFTPDGDGLNDRFQPVVQGADEKNYDLYIYDRWGEVVFEGHHPEASWDGTIKGSGKAKPDVYVWKIVAKSKYTGKVVERTGHVTLLR